ncbi:MAG: hypothetical protein LBT48_00500 [Prevotellaceae bacterium]|jgi:hypothetical protein|nr:hypothetical protein [Prevotellaceae bacterium]
MWWYVMLFSIAALALCFAGLAITILIKKNGKFPETEISRNPHMRKLGIRCAKQDALASCGGCGECSNPAE